MNQGDIVNIHYKDAEAQGFVVEPARSKAFTRVFDFTSFTVVNVNNGILEGAERNILQVITT